MSTPETLKAILAAIGIAGFFILLIVLEIRAIYKKQVWVKPKFLRLIIIAVGLFVLVSVWIIGTDDSILMKVILSIFAAYYIYSSLNGWLIKPKVR